VVMWQLMFSMPVMRTAWRRELDFLYLSLQPWLYSSLIIFFIRTS